MTPQEAKAWLIQQILSDAEHTATPLDPLEARMLEYSESARTPHDLEALQEEFDRTHDQAAYEARIAALIRTLHARWRADSSPKLALWHNALRILGSNDHYLLTLIARAGKQESSRATQPQQRSLLKVFLIAILLTIAVTLLLGYLAAHLR